MIVNIEEIELGFEITYESDDIDSFNKWKTFIAEFLKVILGSGDTFLVTEDPQTYSFVFSLGIPTWTVEYADSTFSIVKLDVTYSSIINAVVDDEEFDRGLLWICQTKPINVDVMDHSKLMQLTTSKVSQSPVFDTVFAGKDGTILFCMGEKENFLPVFQVLKSTWSISQKF